MTVFFYTHASATLHDTGPGHPENAFRVQSIMEHLDREPVAGMVRHEAPRATIEQLSAVHPKRYIEAVLDGVPKEGLVRIDGDTVMSPHSGDAALRQSGGVCAGVDAVMAGKTNAAFVCMRPPGHHAEPEQAMGFCLFNGVAVGAMHARQAHGCQKVAVFDFDVHHGNGTQAMFWDDPDAQYLSTHQMPLFPGTGSATERGAHRNIVNVPCRPGTGGREWRSLVEKQILPSLEAFDPDFLLVSAGFDAHRTDPLAQMELVEDDFAWVTDRMVEFADARCDGRLVSVLEGGYNPTALAASVRAHLARLV